jgi:hypothetical protein
MQCTRIRTRRFDLIPVAVTLFTLVMMLQNAVLTEGRYRKPVEPTAAQPGLGPGQEAGSR